MKTGKVNPENEQIGKTDLTVSGNHTFVEPGKLLNVHDEPKLKVTEKPSLPVDFSEWQQELPLVLIVEDNEVNTQLMIAFMKKVCLVETAKNGEEAIQLAKTKNYALILMDVNLGGGLSGIETTQIIRNMTGYFNTPIIAVTGLTLSAEREKILNSGFSHYLAKPFTKKALNTMIENALYLK